MSHTGTEFYVVIERDEDGYYVGEVPQLRACYSQGRTVDELMANMRDVIAMCLAEEPEYSPSEFVGVLSIRSRSPDRHTCYIPSAIRYV